MTPERFQRIKAIFLTLHAAKEEDRKGLLQQECGDDHELLRFLQDLVRTSGEEGELDRPALGDGFSLPSPEDLVRTEESVDRQIYFLGSYRIHGTLGRGSMGTVFRAEQSGPRRDVALKILAKIDPDRDDMERFRAEAEALGRLQHPGIAKIFDSGVAEGLVGPRPFLAMELVRGHTLLRYADSARLGFDDRVRLLVEIADAVHHAHERSVLHLDLKPENILVDGDGHPRVVDLGIALLQDRVARIPRPPHGTPPYMAPEQTIAGSAGLSAAADVHALGWVGRELLESTASGRKREEVEAVFRRATAKAPSDRYPTAQALAEDLNNVRQENPVLPLSGRAAYRIRTWGARNRRGVIRAASIAALLSIASLWVWHGQSLLSQARSETTELREDVVGEAERGDHLRGQLLSLLQTQLSRSGLTSDGALDTAVALSEGMENIAAGDPLISVALNEALSSLYHLAGRYDLADQEATEGLLTAVRTIGVDHPVAVRLRSQRGLLCLKLGRFEEAEALLKAAIGEPDRLSSSDLHSAGVNLSVLLRDWGRLEESNDLLQELLASMGPVPGGPVSPEMFLATNTLSEVEHMLGVHGDTCRAVLKKSAVDRAISSFGEDHPVTMEVTADYAWSLGEHGHHSEAIAILEDVLARQSTLLGESHPLAMETRHLLARVLFGSGAEERGLSEQSKVLKARTSVLGIGHPETMESLHNEAWMLDELGQSRDAAVRFEALLPLARASLPNDHRMLAIVTRSFGRALLRSGDHERALAPLREASARWNRRRDAVVGPLGAADLMWLQAETSVSEALFRAGKFDEASIISARVAATYAAVLGPDHPNSLRTKHNHGFLLYGAGRLEEANQQVGEALRRQEAVGGMLALDTVRATLNHTEILLALGRFGVAQEVYEELADRVLDGPKVVQRLRPEILRSLGVCLSRANKDGEAIERCREALETHESVFGRENEWRIRFQTTLAMALIDGGEPAEAEPILREALDITIHRLGQDHPTVFRIQNNLATALSGLSKPEESGELYAAAAQGRSRVLGPDHPDTLISRNNLARHLERAGAVEEARAQYLTLCRDAETRLSETSYALAIYRLNRADFLASHGEEGVALELVRASLRVLLGSAGTSNRITQRAQKLAGRLERAVAGG